MGGRAPEDSGGGWRPPAPNLAAAFGVAGVVLLVLVSNGRPIGAGDTRPTERVAASLVQEGNLDLDEYPEVSAPFARTVGDHRLSIYPVLSGVLAAPLFALARPLFALDEAGTALVGKLAASLFAALAAAALKAKWPGNNANRERPTVPGNLGDNGSGSSSGTTTHATGYKNHIGTMNGLLQIIRRLFGSFFADFRITARAQTTGQLITNTNTLGRVAHQ